MNFSTQMWSMHLLQFYEADLVLDLSADLLQCFLLSFGQGQLGGHRVSFSDERAFLLLRQQERTGALQFLSDHTRGGHLTISFNKIQHVLLMNKMSLYSHGVPSAEESWRGKTGLSAPPWGQRGSVWDWQEHRGERDSDCPPSRCRESWEESAASAETPGLKKNITDRTWLVKL